MTEAELTILRAAANIARDHAVSLAQNENATTDERNCVSAGLLAHIWIENYLTAIDDLERPF